MKKIALIGLLCPLAVFGQIRLQRAVVGASGNGLLRSNNIGVVAVSHQSSPIQIKYSENLQINQGFIQPFVQDFHFENIHLTIYPNPVSDILTVKADSDAPLTLKIADLKGLELVTKDFEKEEKVKIKGLARGLYLISFYSNNRYIGTKKLIIH